MLPPQPCPLPPPGFAVASFTSPTTAPPPAVTDALFATLTGPPLVVMDGASLAGAFGIPASLRRAIAAETVVYTAAMPVDTLGASAGGSRGGAGGGGDADDDRGVAPRVPSR